MPAAAPGLTRGGSGKIGRRIATGQLLVESVDQASEAEPQMMNSKKIADRFLTHNFHDARLRHIHIQPAEDKRSQSSVEVILEDYDTDELIHITFKHPGNISFIADFDVLLDNAGFGNTSHTNALTDHEYLLKIINQQKNEWNVTYDERMRSPIAQKIDSIDKYISFRILFFGGSLEIVAKNYAINRRDTAS